MVWLPIQETYSNSVRLMATIQLSKNFTLDEMTASATAKAKGIANRPLTQHIVNMTALCLNVLQPLRDAMREPIKIGSGYRCGLLNEAVGGVKNSQHMSGQAADLCIDGNLRKGRKWFDYIKEHLDFDQLIWEHNSKGTYWVHVSYRNDGNNRRQVIADLLK